MLATTVAVLATSLLPLPSRAGPGDANCDGDLTVGDAASVASAIFTRTDCAGADANCDGAVSAPDITNTVTCVADPANCSACRVPPPVAGNWLFHELYVTPSGRGSGYSTGTGALDTNGCGNFTVTGLDNEGAPIGGGV